MVTPVDLDTNDLQRIKEAAIDYANTPGTNPFWQRAYLRLADVVDHLDAMRKRSIVKLLSKKQTKKGANDEPNKNG